MEVEVLAIDHEGNFIQGLCKRFAVTRAVSFAKSFSAKLVLKSNASRVIKMLLKEVIEDLYKVGHLLNDIQWDMPLCIVDSLGSNFLIGLAKSIRPDRSACLVLTLWVSGLSVTTNPATKIKDKFREPQSLENFQSGVIPEDTSPEREEEEQMDKIFVE
ncbi:hypothetical protein ACH5RR_021420 [Cinchona calisaya]|uniref:Uncharacterized protein n=1 Tax=Cinchona calisaya TaxID=153742 RepID=A0ABD2ZJ12_9GENT